MAAANDAVARLTHIMAAVEGRGYFGYVTEKHVTHVHQTPTAV